MTTPGKENGGWGYHLPPGTDLEALDDDKDEEREEQERFDEADDDYERCVEDEVAGRRGRF